MYCGKLAPHLSEPPTPKKIPKDNHELKILEKLNDIFENL
jgi:hypothetical protein